MEDITKIVENIDAMGSIATGKRGSELTVDVISRFVLGEISYEQAREELKQISN